MGCSQCPTRSSATVFNDLSEGGTRRDCELSDRPAVLLPRREVVDLALVHPAGDPQPPIHHQIGSHQTWCPLYRDFGAGAGPGPTAGPQRPKCRDDSGLTTLEWLLIVAAVAGVAALAVVLVQVVVEDTGEDIANNNPRVVAVRIAIGEIDDDAAAQTDVGSKAAYTRLNRQYQKKCNRLAILYSDIDNLVTHWIWGGTGPSPGQYDQAQWDMNFVIKPGNTEPFAGCRLLVNGKELSRCC